MDLQRAKEILAILADGIDPVTGEVLPAEDSCNHPEVIRALHTILSDKKSEHKSARSLPENAGKPWTSEDDAILCEMYDRGDSPKSMSSFFKRTSGSIAARLVRLGKITERAQLKESTKNPNWRKT